MVRLLPYVVPVALALYALIDLARSEPGERADLTTPGWVVAILVLPVVGPLAWVVVSRLRRASAASGGTSGPAARRPAGPGAPRRRPGPLAPDDDPDFLWRLEQEQRRREGGEGPTGPGEPKDGSTKD